MDSSQLSTYLSLLDWPCQVSPSPPHPTSLALLSSKHLMTLPYQSKHLHHHKTRERPSLAVKDLLSDLPTRGGHCYQHSELCYAALIALGYKVSRVSSCVLNGRQYREGMPQTHNILVVSLDGSHYLVDVGFANGSPRFPLKLTFSETEEVDCAQGERYRLEVSEKMYLLYLWLKDQWFVLYMFQRDPQTNFPRTVTQEETMDLFSQLYTSTATIGIRDLFIKVSIQTQEARINFNSQDGVHELKIIQRGEKVEERRFETEKEFYGSVRELCHIDI